jgi:hypothetical protein
MTSRRRRLSMIGALVFLAACGQSGSATRPSTRRWWAFTSAQRAVLVEDADHLGTRPIEADVE